MRRFGPMISFAACAALAAIGAAALAAACGASVQGTGSPSPPPVDATPAPIATITAGPPPDAAVTVAREYLALFSERRVAEAKQLLAPGSPALAPNAVWSTDRFRVVSVDDRVSPFPPTGATLEFALTVDVTPGEPKTLSPGRQSLWVSMARTSSGDWLVYELGTGP